jgi:heat shock protein 1/8
MATSGDTHLGGEDFDSSLADWVSKQVLKKHKQDFFTDNPKNYRRLRSACESAKRQLSR